MVDELIIGIGSSQHSHLENNPFTSGERAEMILRSMTTEEKNKIILVQIPDINDYDNWMSMVKKRCPPFDIIFTRSDLTMSLAKAERIEAKLVEPFNADIFNGTAIRVSMTKDDEWMKRVPSGTLDVINDIDGIGRVKELKERVLTRTIILEEEIARALVKKGYTISIAESCTGGQLSKR